MISTAVRSLFARPDLLSLSLALLLLRARSLVRQLGPIGSGYVNDNPFAKNVVLAFKRYFATSGFEPKIMQVKALDNSAAGVGIHLRWFAAGADKSLCDGVATSIYANTPGATDAEKDIAAAWLFENVFKPYEVGVLGVAPGDYFGAVTRRASMPACWNMGMYPARPTCARVPLFLIITIRLTVTHCRPRCALLVRQVETATCRRLPRRSLSGKLAGPGTR